MKKTKILIQALLLTAGVAFTSCDDLFEPAIENHLGFEYMYDNPDYADGVLGNAYTRLPNASYSFSDVATDDAVSNATADSQTGSYLSYKKMTADGNWKSNNNPLERWRNCRAAIQYINLFLENIDKIKFNSDEKINAMYRQRYLGEAHGLRAIYMYYLLQAHGGYDANGNLLGVPILTESTNIDSDHASLEVRASFADCMKALKEDANKAIKLLPLDYKDRGTEASEVEIDGKKFTVTGPEYDRVFGENFAGRISGRIMRAVLAQASILAASPAFNAQSGETWKDACKYAQTVLDLNGGVDGIDPDGNTWYCNTKYIDDSIKAAKCPKEVLWRTESGSNNDLEAQNYPPSIYGKGRVNPTQNLVDAFPMVENGRPISDPRSGFDAANPYDGRDPRLAQYVLYNGQKAGNANTAINTQADDKKDGLMGEVEKATVTGYYMRKLLRQDINLDPTVNSKQKHYTPRIRYTELYLDFAEAANEAYGPTANPEGCTYSAYDVIKSLRERAGIINDEYLEECKGDQDKMRELIRNERRLELCFEGFRFWDLRRWKANLNETAKGVSITVVEGKPQYNYFDVETRNYKECGYYGPVPYSEVLNFPSLVQNAGW